MKILKAAAESQRTSLHINPVCMAAAILLKQRDSHMCMLQSIVGTLLYAGHAGKKTYGRLQKIGVSIAHNTTIRLIKKMGERHDQVALDWKSKSDEIPSTRPQPATGSPQRLSTLNDGEVQQPESVFPEPAYIIVGDNLDKNVSPRDMRVDSQVKSLHLFHSYALHDRPDFTHLRGDNQVGDIDKLPPLAFLPSLKDCVKLREDYIIMAARVITEKIPCFSHLKKCVPQHIPHQFSQAMARKSEVVPLGVIPKNENKREEMNEVLEILQSYSPRTGKSDDEMKKVLLAGDQLTVERCRGSQDVRINSDTMRDALQGLVPFAADWHAEIFFTRLYKGGSNLEGGTLLQLRNKINRRNVKNDVKGNWNACIDFFELVTKCHIIAAALHFFGMREVSDTPTCSALPSNMASWDTQKQWQELSRVIGCLIDQYVIVRDFLDAAPKSSIPRPLPSVSVNPHISRIMAEHAYGSSSQESHPQVQTKTRRLPPWMASRHRSVQQASTDMHEKAPDGVFKYASAVLNNGLLLLEFRDAIHEVDGERILLCWRFMLLYFRATGHTKYALEAFNLMAASSHVANQITWSRTVNTRGKKGQNIPIDLFMEHLNRTLKDYVAGLGANVSENTIVQCGKSLQGIFATCSSFDSENGIRPESMHHTRKSSKKDEQLIVKQLVAESDVFEYIPGRCHSSFKDIHPNISRKIDASKFILWLQKQKSKIIEKRNDETIWT